MANMTGMYHTGTGIDVDIDVYEQHHNGHRTHYSTYCRQC